jgi:hypothetical protein
LNYRHDAKEEADDENGSRHPYVKVVHHQQRTEERRSDQ